MHARVDLPLRSEPVRHTSTLSPVLRELGVTERRIQLAGMSTAVFEGGEGPPVVLLHGAGEFALTWARVIPELTRTHRVIAPDLPGHGGSGFAGPLDRQHVVTWLGELMDRTCEEPPILIGHLLSGAIAARFAVAGPRRIRHLVLVDSLGLAWYRPAPGFAFAMFAFVARPNERTQDRLFRRCMADLDGVRREMDGRMGVLEAYALERAQAPELKVALRRLMPNLGLPAIPVADLDRISVPTTLIWGRDDLQVPLAVAERASARYGWALHVIDGARDDPAIEQPDAFLAAIHPVLHTPHPAPGTDRVREGWNGIAPDFDRIVTPLALRLGEEAIRRSELRRGMRVLDVAAGSGGLSIPAARQGAHVLATDISPSMVELLAARAAAERLDLEARVMDGYALDLEDDTFDLTASQNGVSVFPDVARGLAEMVRVTRPGGHVLIVSFGPIQDAEFLTYFMGAMRAVIPGFTGLSAAPPPLPFQLANPETMRRRLEEAGLSEVRVEHATWEMEFESGWHLWDTVTSSNPIGAQLVADLPAAQRDDVRRILDGMLRERSGAAGGVLRNAVNIGIGRK